ncbi:MAG: MarC family protein [Alphaproteobacteria bacterium]|jgi:multiple antibiotic resistance protein|nr:MarC family protein [Alphaproteobacteria bacterium]
MFHVFASAFTTLFVAIGPVELAAMFLALTPGLDARTKRRLAIVAAGVAAAVLLAFGLGGIELLSLIGVGLPAFRTAGGVLLLMTSAEMLLRRHSGLTSITPPEEMEAKQQHDIAIFPLAIPLTAGPGSMTAIVLLMGRAHTHLTQGIVLSALLLNILLAFVMMLASQALMRVLGTTGVNVVARVSGILLAALAMQFIFDGLTASRLFG